MTEQPTPETTEPVEAPTSSEASTVEQPEVQAPDEDARGSREAAKYRRQLREAQTELEQARASTDTLRSALFAKSDFTVGAGNRRSVLSQPLDLLTVAGKSLDDFTDQAGGIDQGKITQAVEELHRERPGLFVTDYLLRPIPGEGRIQEQPTPGWESAFEPKREVR